ncbi:MAG: flagellar assembly protein A, partial [Spirochaetota bacterium]
MALFRKKNCNTHPPSSSKRKKYPDYSRESTEIKREVVKVGFARKGDLVATLSLSVPGRNGKNILGEEVAARQPEQVALSAGRNIKVEQGSRYYTALDGKIEVLEDQKGGFHILARPYRVGKFSVSISDDEMQAFLNVTPPVGGGRPVKQEDVLSECRKLDIKFGLDEKTIGEAVHRANQENQPVNHQVIARGEEPVHGEDGKLEYKVKFASGSPYTTMDDGSVDFKEHDTITSVEENQLLAVVDPPCNPVKEGHTVKGEPIRAREGQGVALEPGKNIRKEIKQEQVLYYAQTGGRLVASPGRIDVEPLLTVKEDVGPKTGNVKFDGTVTIK